MRGSFVQQVARYEGIGELHTEVESFVHQDARYEGIVNHVSGLIIRATSCTLRGNRELRTEVVIHSCIKMHATRES